MSKITPAQRKFLLAERQVELEVIDVLHDLYKETQKEIRQYASSKKVKALEAKRDLLRTQRSINEQLKKYYEEVGDKVGQGVVESAIRGIDMSYDYTSKRIRNSGDKAALELRRRAVVEDTLNNIDVVIQRVKSPTTKTFSETVWGTRDLTQEMLNRKINLALLKNKDVETLAKEIEVFVNPDVKGGVRYASLRLARTEMGNAYHRATIYAGFTDPNIIGFKWKLSPAHPKVDICDRYAKEPFYTPITVPHKPHPNCLCWIEPVYKGGPSFAGFRERATDEIEESTKELEGLKEIAYKKLR